MSTNQVVRFALSDATATAPYGITYRSTDSPSIEAGAYGLALVGSIRVGGVCTDYSGNIYVSDLANHVILKIEEGGGQAIPTISILAGISGVSGNDSVAWAAGTPVACASAHFNTPRGICCAKNGDIYVADSANYTIRKISGGYVSTIVGKPGVTGRVDGAGSVARLGTVYGICMDNSGTIFFTDYNSNAVRKIYRDNQVLTMSGNLATGASGDLQSRDGSTVVTGNNYTAAFNAPYGIAVDAAGTVYVCDSGNHKIKKITTDNQIYCHSGSGAAGHTVGTKGSTVATCQPFTATYETLTYCSIDRSNNLYCIDVDGRGGVSTRLLTVNYDGVPGVVADFATVTSPIGVAVSPAQKLFVTMYAA